MTILLPDEFKSYDKDGYLDAEVKDGVLHLYRSSTFRKVMYDLTYSIYGDTCMYCKKNKANSIDHRVPQDFGGPTITNNLYPTCKDCNSLKSNMFEDEFYKYLSFSDTHDRRQYQKSLKPIQEDRRFGTVPSIPGDWISKKKLNVIMVKFYIDEPLGSKYKKLKKFFSTWKRHKNPVIISSNGVLLDGFNTIFIGKLENRTDYDQIILDNVFVDS